MTVAATGSARSDRRSTPSDAPALETGQRSRRAVWNYASGLLYAAVTLSVALFSTPLLIGWLGEDRFGAFRMLIEYGGYLVLLENGLRGALAPLLVRALGRNDERALRATMATGTWLYLAMVLTATTAALALWPWLGSLFGLEGAPLDDLRAAWLLNLLTFPVLMLAPLRVLTEAGQRGYLINLLITVQAVATVLLSLLLAWAGWGILGQVVALLVGLALMNGLLGSRVLRARPGLLADLKRFRLDRRVLARLRRIGPPSLALDLGGRVSYMTDAIVLGAILGPTRVTILYVTQRLTQPLQTQLLGIGTAVWAGLAELHARGERTRFNQRLVELTRLVGLLACAGLVPVVAFNERFIALWDTAEHDGGPLVILTAAINAYLVPLTTLWSWCFTGVGRPGRVVVPLLGSAVVNLLASVALTRGLGLTAGPLLGSLLALVGVQLWSLPWMLHRDFGTSRLAIARAIAGPLALSLPTGLALWWIAHRFPPPNLFLVLVAMAAAGLAVLLLGAFTLLEPADRDLWRARILAALPARLVKR